MNQERKHNNPSGDSSGASQHSRTTETNPFAPQPSAPQLTVTNSEASRTNYVSVAGGDSEFSATLTAADVLVVPIAGHGDYRAPVFPQGTLEVLHFLRERLPDGVVADIAVRDDAYEELTLHAAELILPTFLANPSVASIAINLLSAYLYDLLKGAKVRRQTRVRASVLVETSERVVDISYDGPADQFAELMRLAFEREVPRRELAGGAVEADGNEPIRLIDSAATGDPPSRPSGRELSKASRNEPETLLGNARKGNGRRRI